MFRGGDCLRTYRSYKNIHFIHLSPHRMPSGLKSKEGYVRGYMNPSVPVLGLVFLVLVLSGVLALLGVGCGVCKVNGVGKT